jgi:hypothetical protein
MDEYQIITIDGSEYIYDYLTDNIIPTKNNVETKSNQSDKSKTNIKNIINEQIESNDISSEEKILKNELGLWYPDKPDIDLWESYLNRELTLKEKNILLDVVMEKELNNCIKGLQQNLLGNNCFIPSLTNNNGNCLFESLGILGYGDNDLNIQPHIMIRNNLSSMLLYMRNIEDFFPNLSITPEEIFNNSNEVEFVKNNKTGEVYVYNYDMMICDLRTNYSWERLPTELILMTISRIYQVKILIYHNKTQYVNEVNVWKGKIPDESIDIIRLGHINEEHYIPVLKLDDELCDDIETIHTISKLKIKYDTKKINYNEWAKNMALYLLQIQESDINTNFSINTVEPVNQSNQSNVFNFTQINDEPDEKLDLKDFEFL